MTHQAVRWPGAEMSNSSSSSSKFPQCVKVTDMHTAAEPLRIIESVKPELLLPAGSSLQRRRWLRENFDELRQFVIHEPRGHSDMYGALLMPPPAGCHLSVLFMHNEGYSTMCGHAVIALTKYAVTRGLVQPTPPVTKVNIECPCGIVEGKFHHSVGDQPDSSSFTSVASFLFGDYSDLSISGRQLAGLHIAYGGAFYAILPGAQLQLDIRNDPVGRIAETCKQLKQQLASVQLRHPDNDDLAFLYGVIVTDGDDSGDSTEQICVFADGEVDRSPTGSGVTARMAALFARGLVAMATWREFRNSKTGSLMRARVVEQLPGDVGVRVEVVGSASFTGVAELTAEAGDTMLPGFRVT